MILHPYLAFLEPLSSHCSYPRIFLFISNHHNRLVCDPGQWFAENWTDSVFLREFHTKSVGIDLSRLYINVVVGLIADQLLRRIRENDHEFIAELRQIIEQIVRKWNWTDSDSANDIAQDCFMKVVENLSRGKFEGRSSFKTYVYTITRRTCIDYYKSARAVQLADIDQVTVFDSALSPEDQVIAQEQRKTAYRVLMSLPKECRNLWRAVFFGKRNYKQVAEQLGLSEGTVKRKMWKCRQLAKEKVEYFEK